MLTVIIGCKQEHLKITTRYENGNIEHEYFIDKDAIKQGEFVGYFPNGVLSFKTNYTDGKTKDTIYYFSNNQENKLKIKNLQLPNGQLYYEGFYPNGIISHKGVLNKQEKKVGIWKNYDKAGNLHFVKEYKIINGKEHTNQLWVMLPSGDTLTEGVSMKQRFDKSKLTLSDSIFCYFQTEVSAFKNTDSTQVSVVIPEDYTQQNFTSDFSNLARDPEEKEGIPTRTISDLATQKQPHTLSKNIPVADQKKTVMFYWKPKRTGKDTLRGFFNERHSFYDPDLEENQKENRILTQLNKKIYFEHPIEVVDD